MSPDVLLDKSPSGAKSEIAITCSRFLLSFETFFKTTLYDGSGHDVRRIVCSVE